MKRFMLLTVLFVFGFFLIACESENNATNGENDTPETLIYLTLEQLSEFDGLEGRDAYIAIDGKIYDVTNSSRWVNGAHNGYQAGQDLTAAINDISPHGTGVLSRMDLIGEIVEE